MSQAENSIALLDRCQPQNGPAESERWTRAFRRGEAAQFAFRHSPPPELTELRQGLERARAEALAFGAVGALYSARATELGLEAELAENVGGPRFMALARLRHPVGTSAEWAAAEQLATRWAAAPPAPDLLPIFRSDDASSADSLVSQLRREIGRLRLPMRVSVVSRLGSRAATGDGVILVRAGVMLSARQASRIAQHEIVGHAVPRVNARHQPLGLFRVGSADAIDDEEGRAIRVEQRTGLLDDERRHELGLRHLAALAVAGGASAMDCVRMLLGHNCPLEVATALYCRVARGGGLCRELMYLPAWLRVRAAFIHEPDLERWLEHGRLSLHAAAVLRELGIEPVTPGDASKPSSPGP